MDRIVFKDYGTVQGKAGKIQHKVDFAYACDRKSVGRDEIIPNPYLKSYRVKGSDGKVKISHSDFLAEPVYQRLKRYAVTDGISASSVWDGMVDAKVNCFRSKQGKQIVYVDLTEQAEKEGAIMAPTQPFDEQAHNQFVKASLAEYTGGQSEKKQVRTEDVRMRENEAGQKNLTRILVKDLGVRTGKDGNPYHRMQFAYACDQMKIGEDVPIAHTYLQSISHNKNNGKTYANRDYYLSDDVYQRLMQQMSTAGCEKGKWAGVVNAQVQKSETRSGYRMMLNLSDKAVRKRLLQTPDVPFEESKHNAFVKASQRIVQEQRIAEAEKRLPDMAASVDTERQFGE